MESKPNADYNGSAAGGGQKRLEHHRLKKLRASSLCDKSWKSHTMACHDSTHYFWCGGRFYQIALLRFAVRIFTLQGGLLAQSTPSLLRVQVFLNYTLLRDTARTSLSFSYNPRLYFQCVNEKLLLPKGQEISIILKLNIQSFGRKNCRL